MALISVIVPVYNVEEYLPLCLDSIRRQSYSDIEIIGVDDGSTDRSGEILAMAARIDPRVKIVTKANGGLSSARNAGIEVAGGQILMFVDSDDWLEKNACQRVAAAFAEHDPEVLTFGAYCRPKETATPWLLRTLSPRNAVYEGFSLKLLFDEQSRPYVWRSAFAADFFRRTKIRFHEDISFGEDQVFYFEAYPQAAKTVLLHERLYSYRVSRRDSLMDKKPLVRLAKNQVIARRVLEIWQAKGWLTLYPQPLLEWVITFLAFEIYAQPNPGRAHLVGSLRDLLDDFFPSDHLPPGLDSNVQRLLSRIRRVPRGARRVPSEQLTIFRFFLNEQGLLWGVNRLIRGFAAAQPLRKYLRYFLPPPATSVERRINEIAELSDDASRRVLALELLKMEYARSLAEVAEQPDEV